MSSRRKPGPIYPPRRQLKDRSRLSPGRQSNLAGLRRLARNDCGSRSALRVLCESFASSAVKCCFLSPRGGAGLRPGFGISEEALDRRVLTGGEAALAFRGLCHVPPGGERQEGNAFGGEARLDL